MRCLLSGRRVSYARVLILIIHSFKTGLGDASCRRHRLPVKSDNGLFQRPVLWNLQHVLLWQSTFVPCQWVILLAISMRTKKYGSSTDAQPSTAFASAAAMKLCFYYYNSPIFSPFLSAQRQFRYLRLVRHHDTDVNFNYIRYRCRFGNRYQDKANIALIL